MTKIFIDGSAGTTGLRIYERMAERADLEWIRLDEATRKDPAARADAINRADVAFLCLPDAAAVEAVAMIDNPNTAVIDTSTAHRTNPAWTYGFPEVKGLREQIKASKRIANPGCHASGFVALVAPLVENGLIDPNATLSCFSLTGYSGGGKKMIAEYEAEKRDPLLAAPRMYGLTQQHKHLKEMAAICGLANAPLFCPIVAPYYSGMEVTVPLSREMVNTDMAGLKELYSTYYGNGGLVHYTDEQESGFLSASAYSGRDDMHITVCGNEERILLVARFDNLGKGASGSAIQNMNILLGLDEATGLNLA
ncbi:MAG: N-acetyl-gamma-glutamyl-phosphate reductase [Clostridia bacterium]|nr:N-acetyl-gamma-glutamyl-phosphate reductase [Clostridia bacterium]